MKKKTRHVDTGPAKERLASKAFENLKESIQFRLPEQTDAPAETQTEREETDNPPYLVARTRKGNWPVEVEKRPKGKHATVVRNVEGDADALLKQLTKRCAAGGAVKGSAVEIQGDHRRTISQFLDEQLGGPCSG
jgi:translation initiation factor 1 (eIF-1/SUI1)